MENPASYKELEKSFNELAERLVDESLHEYFGQVEENLGRLNQFVVLQGIVIKNLTGQKEAADDLLRAAVVFAHATLEDFLRTVAQKWLAKASPHVLQDIPLAGTKPGKFALSDLVKQKGNTVDQVIENSIVEYLEGLSFNRPTDIVNLLRRVGIDVDESGVRGEFADLEALMTRRHRIVHRADRAGTPGQASAPLTEILERDVVVWISAVESFGRKLLRQLLKKDLLEGDRAKEIRDGFESLKKLRVLADAKDKLASAEIDQSRATIKNAGILG